MEPTLLGRGRCLGHSSGLSSGIVQVSERGKSPEGFVEDTSTDHAATDLVEEVICALNAHVREGAFDLWYSQPAF